MASVRWQRVHVCGAGPDTDAETAFAETFAGWVAGLRTSATKATIIDAFEEGDTVAAVDAFGWEKAQTAAREDIPALLTPPFVLAYGEGISGITPVVPAMTDKVAVAWARRYSTALAKRALNRPAVMKEITAAVDGGWSVPRLSSGLRSLIGLDDVRAASFRRYADALPDDTSDTQWVKLTEARYRTLIASRATTLARTELITASNQGRLSGYDHARASGAVSDKARKRWLADDSDRTCDVCSILDGTDVALDDMFDGDIDCPPAHPGCRCTTTIVDELLGNTNN